MAAPARDADGLVPQVDAGRASRSWCVSGSVLVRSGVGGSRWFGIVGPFEAATLVEMPNPTDCRGVSDQGTRAVPAHWRRGSSRDITSSGLNLLPRLV